MTATTTGSADAGRGVMVIRPSRGDAVERPAAASALHRCAGGQIGWTFSAWGPLAPGLAVNSTRWFSWRLR